LAFHKRHEFFFGVVGVVVVVVVVVYNRSIPCIKLSLSLSLFEFTKVLKKSGVG